MEYIRDYAGDKSPLYKFEKAKYYSEYIGRKMHEKGFCMFVRAGNPMHKKIMEKYKDKNSVVIYSMWKGYLEQDKMKDFLKGYQRVDMHTSGHADFQAIQMVIEVVEPAMIIPMHTTVPEAFLQMAEKQKIVFAMDKQVIQLEDSQ